MISKIFFVVTILYILWAIFLSKEKFHLLMIPFILNSSFFGFYNIERFGEKLGDFILVVILAIWFFHMLKGRKSYWTKYTLNHSYLIVFFLVFLIYVLVVSILKYQDFSSSFMLFRRLFRYISIFLFIGIMFRFEKQEINKLSSFIEKVTVGLSVLYIIHSGLGIKIFHSENYGEYFIGGQTIFRNFLGIPFFIMFSLAHVSLKEEFNIYNISAIFIIILALFLTYTRSLLIMGILIMLGGLFIRAAKYSKSFSKIFRFIVILPLASLVVFGIISAFFPVQAQYFTSRIENISGTQSALEDQTVNLRAEIIKSRINKVLEVNPISGLGFVGLGSSAAYYPDLYVRKGDPRGLVIVGDQSWGNIIALLGFLGSLLYVIMIIYPVFFLLSHHLFLKQENCLIAASLNLIGILFIRSFAGTILIDGVYLISFLIALIIIHTNNFIIEYFSLNLNTSEHAE